MACAAAVATLDVIADEGLVENAAAMGKLLRAALEETASRHERIADVRGLGLMQACEFVLENAVPDADGAKAVVAAAFRRGLILLTCGPYGNIVRMIPALTVSSSEIADASSAWNAAVDEALGRD